MRQLHPVAAHEKFVASGKYLRYDSDNNPTGQAEYWSIHELPDGAQLIRVDVDERFEGRDVGGGSELIEAWRSPEQDGGRIERVDIRFFSSKTDAIELGRVIYIFGRESVEIGYNRTDEPRRDFEIPLAPNCVVSIGISKLFFGYTIADVARANGKCVAVFHSNISHLNLHALSHQPKATQNSAVRDGENIINVSGRPVEAVGYRWDRPCNPVPDDIAIDPHRNPIFWLDEHKILLEEGGMRDGLWTARLTQYARRPEPPKPT
jgi:hypothetical protein